MIILIINLLYKVIVEILLENKKSDNNGSNYGQLSQFSLAHWERQQFDLENF